MPLRPLGHLSSLILSRAKSRCHREAVGTNTGISFFAARQRGHIIRSDGKRQDFGDPGRRSRRTRREHGPLSARFRETADKGAIATTFEALDLDGDPTNGLTGINLEEFDLDWFMAATPDLSKLYVSGDNRVQSIALGVPSEAQDADGVDPDGETLEGMPFDPSLLPFVCPMTALLMLTGSLLGALWTGTRTSPTPRR